MTNIIGKLFGGGGGEQAALLKGLSDTMGGSGVTGLIDKFDAVGLGDKARSWVGDGAKEPVSSDEVKQALGEDQVEQIAEKAHMEPEQASEGLASILPETVSKLTPGGKIPGPGELQDMMKKLPGM